MLVLPRYERETDVSNDEFTPTEWEVREEYAAGNIHAEAEFDRMIAEVERDAAAKARDRCVGEMPIDPDWKNFYSDNNPYRAAAYRQEREER